MNCIVLYKMEYFVMLLLIPKLFLIVTVHGQICHDIISDISYYPVMTYHTEPVMKHYESCLWWTCSAKTKTVFQKKSLISFVTFTRYRIKSSCCTGFTGFPPQLCYDKNECSINNGECAQNCHNTYGSYYCSCDSGYILSANERNCDDINECDIHNGGCQHTCINSDGSYSCSCNDGYSLDLDDKGCSSSLRRYTKRNNPNNIDDLDFYVGAISNVRGTTSSYQLYITTLSQTNVNYTIEQKSGIITSGTVSISSPAIVSLNTSLVSLDSSYMYRNQGIHVHSDGQISLIVVNYRSISMDIYQAYPHQMFPVFQYQYYAVSIGSHLSHTMSEILLIGNIDNTIITITPTADLVVPIDIHSANSPSETILAQSTKTIKLHLFQTFLFGATGVDFSGTSIVSNQPLTVVSGHECGNIPFNINFCDHVSEQIPPTVTWGKKFILTPYKGRTVGQYFKLISSENTTTIMHNCDSGVSTIIHLAFAGDVDIFYTNYTTYCYLESDKPLLVTQMIPSYDADGITGDPSISIIYPIDRYKRDISFFSNFSEITQHYINIIVTQQDTMLMDGLVLSLSWNSICNLNNEIVGYAAQVTITSLGAHVITSTSNVKFTVLAYGYASLYIILLHCRNKSI